MPPSRVNAINHPRNTNRSNPDSTAVISGRYRAMNRSMAPSPRGRVVLHLPFYSRSGAMPITDLGCGRKPALGACEFLAGRRECVIRARVARRGDAGVAGPTLRSRKAARRDAGAHAAGRTNIHKLLPLGTGVVLSR